MFLQLYSEIHFKKLKYTGHRHFVQDTKITFSESLALDMFRTHNINYVFCSPLIFTKQFYQSPNSNGLQKYVKYLYILVKVKLAFCCIQNKNWQLRNFVSGQNQNLMKTLCLYSSCRNLVSIYCQFNKMYIRI